MYNYTFRFRFFYEISHDGLNLSESYTSSSTLLLLFLVETIHQEDYHQALKVSN